jgi:hypothetical protein
MQAIVGASAVVPQGHGEQVGVAAFVVAARGQTMELETPVSAADAPTMRARRSVREAQHGLLSGSSPDRERTCAG